MVSSTATECILDDELIPGLKDPMKDYALLGVSETLVTAGKNELLGTATGNLYGIIDDQTGKNHLMRFVSLIGSGLGRHVLSSSSDAMTRGITTVLGQGNPPLRIDGVVVPTQQRKEDLGLVSLKEVRRILQTAELRRLGSSRSNKVWDHCLGTNPRERVYLTESKHQNSTQAAPACAIIIQLPGMHFVLHYFS